MSGSDSEAATAASLDLEFVRERLRLGLGARLGWFATSLTTRVSPLGVQDATALEDTRHDLRAGLPEVARALLILGRGGSESFNFESDVGVHALVPAVVRWRPLRERR